MCRWESVESGGQGETARNVGDHVEDHNGGSIHAVEQTHEEV